MKVTAYHGTDRCDFSRFDMKRVEPFNVGLHFGTKAAALSRIAYLRENGRAASMRPPQFRLLACELTLNNPLRIDDVFGHSYGMLFDVLGDELGKAASMMPPPIPNLAALQRRFDRLSDRWMSVDDDQDNLHSGDIRSVEDKE